MNIRLFILAFAVSSASAATKKKGKMPMNMKGKENKSRIISLGPRPYYLVDTMQPSFLKEKLSQCASTMTNFKTSDFSIGHRGSALMMPEHTERSYRAAALMGAGVVECDVTFTKDLELVCRHAQCDLHTTTDVVLRPELNAKCSTPWVPESTPKCCTTDFTLDEIKMLCAKMDSSGGPNAFTADSYVYGGTPDYRTDLYQYGCPKVVTHKESIELIKSLGSKFTPELKIPEVPMPFDGFTQEDFAQKMIDEYVAAGVKPANVWPQSFNPPDVYYWVANTDYGEQAVALDANDDSTKDEVEAFLAQLVENGVKIVAPPVWRLVDAAPDTELKMGASHYAMAAKDIGLDIITWTLERTPPGLQGYYWQTLNEAGVPLVDGDNYALLYVLAKEVGILGIFSDWPATVTFFANCYKLKLR